MVHVVSSRGSMQSGKLILTPGVECNNNMPKHYSVFAAQNMESPQEHQENSIIFTNAAVGGALFMQHHMMQRVNKTGRQVARSRSDIIQSIQSVKSVNAVRIKNSMAPISCAFDAEPAPVQERRYFHNPNNWPAESVQQAKQLREIMHRDQLDVFLEQTIELQGYYPLLPCNRTVAWIAESDRGEAQAISYAIGAITGRALGQLGIDTLYAPVCDMAAQAFRERCYGGTVEVIISCATQWILGALAQRGIEKICLKHAPGHGVRINKGLQSQQDTHNNQCISRDTYADIIQHMQVFTEVVQKVLSYGVDKQALSVMTSHIIMTALDALTPVSSSQKAITFIRANLPPGIPLVADCINMAGYADNMSVFHKRLQHTVSLHDGGIIATTHYVKRLSREALIAAYNKSVKS